MFGICGSVTCKLLSFLNLLILLNRLVFFSFAYATSPAAVMKLVVFLRSSKPPYNFWWSGVADGHCAIRSGWCLLHIWRTCSVVWSSSPQGHVGKERFLVSCACERWVSCGRNAVMPKPPGRACQEGGMHPTSRNECDGVYISIFIQYHIEPFWLPSQDMFIRNTFISVFFQL